MPFVFKVRKSFPIFYSFLVALGGKWTVSGAWESKKYYGKAAVESFFSELQSEPTIILQNNIEGTNFFIDLASWVDNAKEPNYSSLLTFSWPNLLDKIRDIQEVNEGEFLTKYLSIINYVFVGLRIDEYCLLDASSENRRKPLLPKFLPKLLKDFPKEDVDIIVELVSEAYKKIYERIGIIESAWVPEIKLQLADVLLQLEKIILAEGEVSISLNQFLERNLIQIKSNSFEEATSQIPLIINDSDRNYISELYQLLLKFPQKKITS